MDVPLDQMSGMPNSFEAEDQTPACNYQWYIANFGSGIRIDFGFESISNFNENSQILKVRTVFPKSFRNTVFFLGR